MKHWSIHYPEVLICTCIIHAAYSLLIPQNECLLDIIICLATVYVFLYSEDNAKVFIIL